MRPFTVAFLRAFPVGAVIGLAALTAEVAHAVSSGASWGAAVVGAAVTPFSWISFAFLYAFFAAFVRPQELSKSGPHE